LIGAIDETGNRTEISEEYLMRQFILRARAALQGLATDQKGVTAVEYGVIAALIIVVCIAAIAIVGTNLNTTFDTVGTSLTR